jgi:glycosyltransferase involved in cell wall biosynthesis
VVPSRFLQEIFARYSVRSQIIPNIVNLDVFHPAADANTNSGAHVVIARNLEYIYGIDVAIRAFAIIHKRIAGAKLSIAGSGPEYQQLTGLCEELGITGCVSFVGRLEVTQMADLYRQADVVLNPSRVDNAPNSILEALACGVPVVSTRAGGIPYLVTHQTTAWLVDVDAVSEMADGLIRVLQDESLRSFLRQNGLKLADDFSWERVKSSWLTTYMSLVNKMEQA